MFAVEKEQQRNLKITQRIERDVDVEVYDRLKYLIKQHTSVLQRTYDDISPFDKQYQRSLLIKPSRDNLLRKLRTLSDEEVIQIIQKYCRELDEKLFRKAKLMDDGKSQSEKQVIEKSDQDQSEEQNLEFIQFWNDISENKPISIIDKICPPEKAKEQPSDKEPDITQQKQRPSRTQRSVPIRPPKRADNTMKSDMYTIVKEKVDKTTEKVLHFWNYINEYKELYQKQKQETKEKTKGKTKGKTKEETKEKTKEELEFIEAWNDLSKKKNAKKRKDYCKQIAVNPSTLGKVQEFNECSKFPVPTKSQAVKVPTKEQKVFQKASPKSDKHAANKYLKQKPKTSPSSRTTETTKQRKVVINAWNQLNEKKKKKLQRDICRAKKPIKKPITFHDQILKCSQKVRIPDVQPMCSYKIKPYCAKYDQFTGSFSDGHTSQISSYEILGQGSQNQASSYHDQDTKSYFEMESDFNSILLSEENEDIEHVRSQAQETESQDIKRKNDKSPAANRTNKATTKILNDPNENTNDKAQKLCHFKQPQNTNINALCLNEPQQNLTFVWDYF